VLWGPYLRGHMAMARVDTRMLPDAYLDAIHAIMVTAPDGTRDRLKQLNDQLVVATAMADPKRARKDWGLRPEHQVVKPLEQVVAPPKM
jgi:hypothetical protein